VNTRKSPPRFAALIRPEVEGFEPYLPGKSMESVRRERGLSRVIKLASNENALGPSPKALRAIAKAGPGFFRYPDGASMSLRRAIAKAGGAALGEVIVGAGSDELIELLAKTFLTREDSIVVSEHAFVRYRLAADLMGARVIAVPMRGYSHDLGAMAAAIRPHTKMVFVANPNNPTGTYNNASELETLLKETAALNRGRARPVLVVVDEAYYEYAAALAPDYPDTLALRRRYAHLVVLRTFSKVHALAGLRVGYGFAAPAVIDPIDRVRPPFNVSVAGQAAAEASLGDAAHVRKSIRLVLAEREKVQPAVARLGLPVVPSIGNFFLMGVGRRAGRAVFESFLARGIIVRSMDEYGFPHHIRVTYGLPRENRAFLKALSEILSEPSRP
jgi:histidinol-phosphate aminotransferase